MYLSSYWGTLGFLLLLLAIGPHHADASESPSIEDGLVAYWPMNDGSGTTAADAASSHDGALTGGPTWTSGTNGQAISFDGQNDEVAIPAVTLQDGTIAAWVKWDTKSTLMAGGDYYEGYWLHFNGGSAWVNWGGDHHKFRDVFETGTWTHVALTRQGGTLRLYKNGALEQTIRGAGTNAAVVRGLGALYAGSGSYQRLDGTLDEVRIYNRALAASEIATLAGESSGGGSENQAPSVTLQTPSDGATYSAPATVSMTASATDADGSISRVEFYHGTQLLATEEYGPYEYEWTSVPAGDYNVKAVAYDDDGASATSTASISVSTGGSSGSTDGLVAHWKFEAGSGSTAFDAASSHDGSLRGPTWTSGTSGQALSFDGQNDGVAIPAITLQDGTIAAWVNWDTKSALMAGGDYAEGYWLHFTGGSAWVNWGGDHHKFRDVFETGTWTHVAMTRQGSTLRLYKNGALEQTIRGAGTNAAVVRGLGALYAGSGSFQRLDGTLDDVRIYDRALGGSEIAALAGQSSGGGSGNQAPSVTLQTPSDGATYSAPATVSMTASASDADGSISRVEFYEGSQLLATEEYEPYEYDWSNVSAGDYVVKAIAYDNSGASTTSTSSITVSGGSGGGSGDDDIAYDDVIYASPNGSAGANGSQNKPYTLEQALDNVASATDAILLQGGTYEGPHAYTHDFDRSTPLVVRSAPGQWARIDGLFSRAGGGIRWQDLEFSVDGWETRRAQSSGSSPSDMPDYGFTVTGDDDFINCIVHDHNGNGFWKTAENILVYGCLFYNQGWDASDRGHGHAAYMQNLDGTKHFKRNVLVKGFSRQTVQAYGSPRSSLQGFNFEENVSIGGRWLVGGESPVARLTMTANHIQGVAQLGYDTGVTNRDATLVDNVLSREVARVGTWQDYSETGTTYSSDLDRVYVYDNAYDDDRGLVVVYNSDASSSVQVDLSSLPLTAGRSYQLVNSLNPSETHEFVYDGSSVKLPMTGWSVRNPVAWSSPVVDNTFPEFGAFLLMGGQNGMQQAFAKAAHNEEGLALTQDVQETDEKPNTFRLKDAYPNPFNPVATIPFELAERADVYIDVYDATGRKVTSLAQQAYSAGQHEVRFEARDLSSGLYFVRARFVSGTIHRDTQSIMLVK